MANNYSQAVFTFDAGTRANGEKLVKWLNGVNLPAELANRISEEIGDPDICGKTDDQEGFEMDYGQPDAHFYTNRPEGDDGKTTIIYVKHDDNFGVVATILQYAQKTMPEVQAAIGFTWADWCDKDRPGQFDGGACVVARGQETKWLSTYSWVEDELVRLAKLSEAAE